MHISCGSTPRVRLICLFETVAVPRRSTSPGLARGHRESERIIEAAESTGADNVRQAAATAQAGVVCSPVRDPMGAASEYGDGGRRGS
jgi:hypothetical protein